MRNPAPFSDCEPYNKAAHRHLGTLSTCCPRYLLSAMGRGNCGCPEAAVVVDVSAIVRSRPVIYIQVGRKLRRTNVSYLIRKQPSDGMSIRLLVSRCRDFSPAIQRPKS